MRRAATVLVTTVLTAGGMAALAPPASAAEIVPQDLTITVRNLGPEHRTCRIDADLYIPAGVDEAHPAPALLATNGFGGTKEDQADLAQGFGEHGYVTLSYTGLGFVDGDNCPITLDDREHDGEAAGQLLRFLGGDRRIKAVDDATGKRIVIDQVIRQDADSGTMHDPAVGMIGGSYGGQVQFATAAVEHQAGSDRLDAIIPLITWNDLAYSLAPENSALPGGTAQEGSVSSDQAGVFKYQWALLFTTLGVANGAEDIPAPTDRAGWETVVRDGCANFDRPVCQALLEVATLGHPSQSSIDFLRSNSVAGYIDQVQVPTLIGQGEADTLFNLQESVATYTSLKAQGTPVSLVWQSWGHSNLTPVEGELDQRHPVDSYQGRQALAWFDHYVRGTGEVPAQDFRYYRDWVYESTGGDIDAAYAAEPAFPVGKEQTLYLSGGDTAGGGTLVGDQADVVPGTSGYASTEPVGPNYTETSYLDQERPVVDPPGSAISFATPPLDQPVDIVGSPRLTVELDSTAAATQSMGPDGQLVAFAKLYDIGPDGAIELPHRLVSPVRIADVRQPVTIELPGIVHRFATGHRLAVVLAGGDLAYRGANLRQAVTLTTGGRAVQQLTLPIAS